MYKIIELDHIKLINLSIEHDFIITKLNIDVNNIYKSYILYNDNAILQNNNYKIVNEYIEKCMYKSEYTNIYHLNHEELLLSNSLTDYKNSYIVIQLLNNDLFFARYGKLSVDDDDYKLYLFNHKININNYKHFFDEQIVYALTVELG